MSDEAVVTLDELWQQMDETTLLGNRTVRIERDLHDWGASGPWEIIYEVAVDHGFDVAVATLMAWIATKFNPSSGLLDDLDIASRVAMRHLRKYHGREEPVLESGERTSDSWQLVIRDGQSRYRLSIFGKHSLVVTVEIVAEDPNYDN